MKDQKLLMLSVLALILFNFPILSIVNIKETINGIPILFFYIFIIWLLLIIVIFRVIKNKSKEISKDE
ncbi:MAG: hypothetical protein MUF58_09790 [Arcicella sp.]|nr:hypothetical protein [Arcicella sp.]